MLKLNSMEQQKTSRGAKIGLGCLGGSMVVAVVCVLGLGFFLFTSCAFNKPLVASGLPKAMFSRRVALKRKVSCGTMAIRLRRSDSA